MKRITKRDKFRAYLGRKYSGLFPPLNEAKLLEVLGGTTVTIGRIRRFNRPMVIVLSRGQMLRSQRFRRAALDGDGMLANDVKWAIAIQGPEYEHDVVAAYERDEYMKAQGWVVRWIPAASLWTNPERVKASVAEFIYQ